MQIDAQDIENMLVTSIICDWLCCWEEKSSKKMPFYSIQSNFQTKIYILVGLLTTIGS